VVDAMLYIAQTGCQWRALPPGAVPSVDPSLVAVCRWSRNGAWARAVTVLHATARQADGRAEAVPSMITFAARE
jgi:putative transposase